MKIENFRLKHFLKKDKELINEYLIALQYVKPLETKNRVFHLTLRKVEFIKKNIDSSDNEALIDVIKMVLGLYEWKIFDFKIRKPYFFGTRKILKLRIVEFFRILASVREQILQISNAEESSLTPSHTNLKWEAVGGQERMSKFGIYNILEDLSDGNALEYQDYLKMEYSEVFTILYMRKTASDLKTEMDEIKTK